jgi:uncharacterized GH25 family protein
VVDAAGGPVAGAMVCAGARAPELSTAETGDPFCATAGADGTYQIAPLFPASYSVDASAQGFLPNRFREDEREPVELAAGERRGGVDLVLRRGGAEVRGRVRDIGGGPVAGALVAISIADFGNVGGSGVFVKADQNGEWRAWMSPGRVHASARAPGYASGSKEGMVPGSFIEVLLTPESVLAGRVVEAGSDRPVPGALVTAAAEEEFWSEGDASALTDAEGRFRVEHLAPGRYKPTARTTGGYGRAAESVLLGVAARSAEVTIELHPATAVTGRVVIAETDKPCKDATVALRDRLTERRNVDSAGADGVVRFRALLAGRYKVSVYCQGHRPEEEYPPVVVAGSPIAPLTWKVHQGQHIAGVVVDASGAPVEGVMLQTQLEGGDPRARESQGWEQTKRDGTFRAAGLLPGQYSLQLMSTHQPTPREPTKVTVEAGRNVEGVRLVLDRGGGIAGSVADEDGAPVPNVQVTAVGESWSWMSDRTMSRDDGSFLMEGVRPGEYRVRATRDGWTELRAPGSGDDDVQGARVDVRPGETARVKLAVERQAGRIRGQVLQGGKPVIDAYVDAERESESATAGAGDAGRSLRWSWNRQPVLTDTEGRFTVSRLAPGRYTVRAFRKGGGEATSEHVAVGATVVLTIKPTGVIEGAVVGAKVEEVRIQLEDVKEGFSRSESFWRTGGRFVLRDLPAGNFHLAATAREGTAEASLSLREGEERRDVRLSIQPRASVRGQVVALDSGQPVPGMNVTVSLAAQETFFGGDDDDRNHITDAQGRFQVENAPAGRVGITVYPRRWDSNPFGYCYQRATLEAGEVSEVRPIRCPQRRTKPRDRGGDLGFGLKTEAPRPTTTPSRSWSR